MSKKISELEDSLAADDLDVLPIVQLNEDNSLLETRKIKLEDVRDFSTKFDNDTPVPTTIGGITAGTVFSDSSLGQVITQLLYPYQQPAFSSFTVSGLSDAEVGFTYIASDRNFTWGLTNAYNVQPNTVTITDVSNSNTILASNISNTGPVSLPVPALTKTTATNHQFRISAVNSQSNSFNRLFTINWRWAMHYGESALPSLSSADVTGLRVKTLVSNSTGTLNMAEGGYKYICYPVSFGLKTTFKDQSTNLDVAMESAVTVSVTNIYGISTNYYVHRSTNTLGGSIVIIVSQ